MGERTETISKGERKKKTRPGFHACWDADRHRGLGGPKGCSRVQKQPLPATPGDTSWAVLNEGRL